jgi:nitrite reductase (NADH) small subunit
MSEHATPESGRGQGEEPEDRAWHDLCAAGDCPDGTVRPAKVAGRLLALGRAEQELFALEGLCPHAGAALGRGLVHGRTLACPRHGFVFDVRSGECQDDPDCSVQAFPVRVHEGRVQIRF